MSNLISNNRENILLALIRAGLWGTDVWLSRYDNIDYKRLLVIAGEQSIVGLVTDGLERVKDITVPQVEKLFFIGKSMQIEQQNVALNSFVAELVQKMRRYGIYALLVKGQGVAQCYEKPLWRTPGDVDFYLSESNYKAAKEFLTPLATNVDTENVQMQHLGMHIDPWVVELHGTMYTELSKKINRGLDEIHRNIFYDGKVRSWDDNGVTVFLPSADNDVLIIFTHIIQHFYIGGIGLKQICDWCRLLWTYKDEIDRGLLESRLRKMGLMAEWKAFATFAIVYLGMPIDAMPLYAKTAENTRRAKKICELILDSGNLGHNHDESYRSRYPHFIQKSITFWRRFRGFARRAIIFPVNSPKFFVHYVIHKTTG